MSGRLTSLQETENKNDLFFSNIFGDGVPSFIFVVGFGVQISRANLTLGHISAGHLQLQEMQHQSELLSLKT